MSDVAMRSADWRDPTWRIPLRWGHPGSRLVGGLLLIVGGGMAVAGASPYVPWLLVGGTIVCLTGWAVLPATGWRRIVAMGPGTLAMWVLLAGPRYIGVLVLAYVAWLLVRHRPFSAYATVLIVIASAIVLGRLFGDYREMLVALGIQVGIMVAAAAAAHSIHRAVSRPRERQRSGSGSGADTQQQRAPSP